MLDPACGDGRFLVAAARRVRALGGRPVLAGTDIDAGSVAAARAATTDADATIACCDALAARVGGAALRHRPRQPAVPVAARRGHDSRRGEPARWGTVRRRGGRVPRPRRPSGAARHWTRRRRRPAVDPRLARCRSRAGGDRPRRRHHVVVVVTCAGLRRRGARLRARPRATSGGPRRRRSAVDRHRHRPARCPARPGGAFRRVARRPRPLERQLPRSVLRARAGGDRRRRRPGVRDERSRRSGPMRTGGTGRSRSPSGASAAPPSISPGSAHRCVGGPRRCSCPRSWWPTRPA